MINLLHEIRRIMSDDIYARDVSTVGDRGDSGLKLGVSSSERPHEAQEIIRRSFESAGR